MACGSAVRRARSMSDAPARCSVTACRSPGGQASAGARDDAPRCAPAYEKGCAENGVLTARKEGRAGGVRQARDFSTAETPRRRASTASPPRCRTRTRSRRRPRQRCRSPTSALWTSSSAIALAAGRGVAAIAGSTTGSAGGWPATKSACGAAASSPRTSLGTSSLGVFAEAVCVTNSPEARAYCAQNPSGRDKVQLLRGAYGLRRRWAAQLDRSRRRSSAYLHHERAVAVNNDDVREGSRGAHGQIRRTIEQFVDPPVPLPPWDCLDEIRRHLPRLPRAAAAAPGSERGGCRWLDDLAAVPRAS